MLLDLVGLSTRQLAIPHHMLHHGKKPLRAEEPMIQQGIGFSGQVSLAELAPRKHQRPGFWARAAQQRTPDFAGDRGRNRQVVLKKLE